MSNKSRPTIRRCTCRMCRRHPYSRIAKEHRAVNRILASLSERGRRQVAGSLAAQQGRGGIQRLHEITGLSRNTIRRGKKEIAARPAPSGRIRHPGGGRKRVEKKHPHILKALDDLLEDATAGDLIAGLKWTRKTTRKLSRQLRRQRFMVSHTTVARLLHEDGYALRGNQKSLGAQQEPERDRQFRYIARKRRAFLKRGLPALSVDTKKRLMFRTSAQETQNTLESG